MLAGCELLPFITTLIHSLTIVLSIPPVKRQETLEKWVEKVLVEVQQKQC